MASKKYLKGFSDLGYRPVTKNDGTGYVVDDEKYKDVPGAVSCSPTDNKEDFEIFADDGIWDSGSEWKSTDLEITVTEAELETMADIIGAEFDPENLEMEEGTFDNAPEIALSFRALRRDGGYRLYRYFSARCTGYSVSHQTKGQDNNSQNYTFRFRCTERKTDGKIRATKDVSKTDDMSWIRSFAATPAEHTGS